MHPNMEPTTPHISNEGGKKIPSLLSVSSSKFLKLACLHMPVLSTLPYKQTNSQFNVKPNNNGISTI
jgi:hypothetical protein